MKQTITLISASVCERVASRFLRFISLSLNKLFFSVNSYSNTDISDTPHCNVTLLYTYRHWAKAHYDMTPLVNYYHLLVFVRPGTSVQNAASRFLIGTRRGDHISPVLRQLHWLPVQRRVDFKLACFVYSSSSGQAPPYLTDDIHLVSEGPRHRLRSSTDRSYAVPRAHRTFGDRSFAAAGPRLWNSLPVHFRDEDITYNSFRHEMKTDWF